MKKVSIFLFLSIASFCFSQNVANRFFYELLFKPDKDSLQTTDKTIAILDISNNKSIYRDYIMVAQDSILKSKVELIKKNSGYQEFSKLITIPKFSYKIIKDYKNKNIDFVDGIEQQLFSYKESPNFDWKILSDKKKIGSYNAQKATTTFGGRLWTAWFSTDLPFSDGPYKFSGLPGLIVQLYDEGNNYNWTLAGNKTIKDYSPTSFTENLYYSGNLNPIVIPKQKFLVSMANYKQNPLASYKAKLNSTMLNQKMPNRETTYGEVLKQQEEALKKFLNANNNPIELK